MATTPARRPPGGLFPAGLLDGWSGGLFRCRALLLEVEGWTSPPKTEEINLSGQAESGVSLLEVQARTHRLRLTFRW